MLALVVDDSRVARAFLKNALRQVGFEVVEAQDGQDALNQLATIGSADVALVDWNMPVMNGLDFVKSVRKNQKYDDLTLMMVTSESEPTQLARALVAGASEYLMKPFTKELLYEKLGFLGLLKND